MWYTRPLDWVRSPSALTASNKISNQQDLQHGSRSTWKLNKEKQTAKKEKKWDSKTSLEQSLPGKNCLRSIFLAITTFAGLQKQLKMKLMVRCQPCCLQCRRSYWSPWSCLVVPHVPGSSHDQLCLPFPTRIEEGQVEADSERLMGAQSGRSSKKPEVGSGRSVVEIQSKSEEFKKSNHITLNSQ